MLFSYLLGIERPMSSAYVITRISRVLETATPLTPFFMRKFSRSAINNDNRIGDKVSPCNTPSVILIWFYKVLLASRIHMLALA